MVADIEEVKVVPTDNGTMEEDIVEVKVVPMAAEAAADMSNRIGSEIHVLQDRTVMYQEIMKEIHVMVEWMMEAIQDPANIHVKEGTVMDMTLEKEDVVTMIPEMVGATATPETKVVTDVMIGIRGVEEAIGTIEKIMIVGKTIIVKILTNLIEAEAYSVILL